MRILELGRVEYADGLQRMRAFNSARSDDTQDELWVLEHPPAFTRGVSCRSVPRQNPRGIEVIDSDRGGQITYHGPGQLICYLLIDLRRSRQGIRQLVSSIEQCVIDTLLTVGIESRRREGAPGVYVGERKIAALGLRVRNGCTYHGLSLNLDMDKAPFTWIDPCGLTGLEVVNVADLVPGDQSARIIHELTARLARIPCSNHSPDR